VWLGEEDVGVARTTQAQRIEQLNEQQAVLFFEGTLSALPDPRRRQGIRYPLRSIMVIALMAMVCGCDDAESMEWWGEDHLEWLKGFLELPHGAPTQDVYLAVFGALGPDAFSAVFRSWAGLLTLRMQTEGKHIAMDGKTSRRSFDRAQGRPAIHTVSAWMSESGLVLGQRKTGEKSNEITAIPELLKTLDLKGATITIDAMGCQTDIASTIVEGQGDYLLAVKENQPTLREDIITTFVEVDDPRRRTQDEVPRPIVEVTEEAVEKAHGRIESRTVTICRDLRWLTTLERWAGLAFVVRVVRGRTVLATGKSSTETAYYIGSHRTANADQVAQDIRRHWGIETKLHWVLDIAFREDEARHRAGNTAQNMTTLRHFALNIVKQDKQRKLGIASSRKRASWNRSYLIKLLTAAQTQEPSPSVIPRKTLNVVGAPNSDRANG
jgi:predicted transposase YbfD/YdcC